MHSQRIIVVRYRSSVLGQGEFWRGPACRIEDIRNRTARTLARLTARDGQTRADGMWQTMCETDAHRRRAGRGQDYEGQGGGRTL